MRIISSYSWLPSSVKAVVAPQDAAHTAETNARLVSMYEVMPDHLGAALERCSKLKHTGDEALANCPWAYVRARRQRGNEPLAGGEPERCSGHAPGSVVVGELDMRIEHIPFALPAPNGAAVYAAAVRYHLQW